MVAEAESQVPMIMDEVLTMHLLFKQVRIV